MGTKEDFANGVDAPVKLKHKKVCEICGSSFIATGNNAKYCEECRKDLRKTAKVTDKAIAYRRARQPGACITYNIENPEQRTVVPETPETPMVEEPKRIDMPDGLALVEEHAEILRRWYAGELVDKQEFLLRLKERMLEL